jgi:RNA polymerase sigma-70 factor, ECF subfamily
MTEPLDVRTMTRGLRSGDPAAFEVFYASHADRMYRYLLVSARGDEELARDVLQDALLRVIRYARPIETAEELWRWLVSLMRSALVDRCRRDGRDRSLPLDREPASEDRATDGLFGQLDEALAALPAEERGLLEEHYVQGASQAEMALRHDSSLKALAMRLSRLRRRVRDLLVKGLGRG